MSYGVRRGAGWLRGVAVVAVLCLAHGCAPHATVPCRIDERIDQSKAAWWVSTCFVVRGERIAGLRAKDIDPSWSAAMVLTEKRMPDAATRKEACSPALRFSFEDDFNKDHRPDRALVGVYQDRSGAVGRFLLILTQSDGGKWTPSFVSKVPGEAGFSTLSFEHGKLDWWMCCACDDGAHVRPKGDGYVLKPLEFGD